MRKNENEKSSPRNIHLKGREDDMDTVPMFVHPVKAAVSAGIAARHMVTVIRELLAGDEARCLTDDFVPLNHQARPVAVQHNPFSAQQCHRPIGRVVNGDEIDERVRFVRRQTRPAVVVAQLVQ